MDTYYNIYKFDSKEKLRVWCAEVDGGKYRTISGLNDGKKVVSEWTTAVPTNVGRANARDVGQQALFEVTAMYKHKLTREYHKTVEEAKKGAHFVKPMLAKEYKNFSSGYIQPKLDGIRSITSHKGLFSRQGKEITSCPHILDDIYKACELFNIILDGELYNHELKDDFNKITSLVRKAKPKGEDLIESKKLVEYHVYDLIDLNNMHLTFSERLSLLNELKDYLGDSIKTVTTYKVGEEADANKLHERFLELGFEGSILRFDTPYEQKRSKNLLKRKEFITEEFECLEINEGSGNWKGYAKKVVCKLPDGREFGAGIKGNQKRAKELLNETHNVVTVRFFQYTPDGIPRFPVVIDFHGESRVD